MSSTESSISECCRYIPLFQSRELERSRLQEMDAGWREDRGEWRGGSSSVSYIYTLYAKMSSAISEIPSCRFPVLLECRLLVFSRPTLSLFLSLFTASTFLPLQPHLYLASTGVHREQISSARHDATWNWHDALKISTGDIRLCNPNRSQIIRAAFNLICFHFYQIKDLYELSSLIQQLWNSNQSGYDFITLMKIITDRL